MEGGRVTAKVAFARPRKAPGSPTVALSEAIENVSPTL
jgi:hypothetical protein